MNNLLSLATRSIAPCGRQLPKRFAVATPTRGYATVVPLFIFIFAGCSQKQQATLEGQIEQAVDVVGKAAAKSATQALQETSKTTTKTLEESAHSLSQGGVALRVKSALTLSQRLDGATIDVDLQGKKIILRGEVLTRKQKAIALSLAENIVDPKFQVVSHLRLGGRYPERQARRSARGY